jgi:DNA-binding MarR family transcriptional regulator
MTRDQKPEVHVEGWLKTLGIESLCQWDMLVFLDRHPSLLVGTENIPFFLGYATAEVVAALDSLESSGLVDRSASQGARLYEVTASANPARRDALEQLMTHIDRHTVRMLLARRLRGSERQESGARSQKSNLDP